MQDLSRLKELVYNALYNASGLSVYDMKIPVNTTFPFVVYKFLSSSNTVRNRTDYILDIDYWTDQNNQDVLSSAMIAVKNNFNYKWQSENDIMFQSHIEFEAEIPCVEENLTHFNQRYNVKVR